MLDLLVALLIGIASVALAQFGVKLDSRPEKPARPPVHRVEKVPPAKVEPTRFKTVRRSSSQEAVLSSQEAPQKGA